MPRYDLGEKRIAGTAEVRESLIKGWGEEKERERVYATQRELHKKNTSPEALIGKMREARYWEFLQPVALKV